MVHPLAFSDEGKSRRSVYYASCRPDLAQAGGAEKVLGGWQNFRQHIFGRVGE